MVKKWVIVIIFSLNYTGLVLSQELNARVTINSDRIEGTNREVFNSLQNALNLFINGQKWSSTVFAAVEKIDCSFSLVLQSQSGDRNYVADLTIQARRPVFNSDYSTSLFMYRDTKFDFEYMENTPIEYVRNTLNNNLVATIAFFCYIILGLDFDSFSYLGGSYFLREAQNIAMLAQGYPSWSGWEAFSSSNNKHAIINGLMDESLKGYRELWYTYHRKGLDEMAANSDRARTTIIQSLPVLNELRDNRSSIILLQLFSDAKLDEVVLLCSKATTEEKKEMYDVLSKVFPTASTRLEPLKK